MNKKVLVADYYNPQHAKDIIYLLDIYSRDVMGGGKPLAEEVKSRLIDELTNIPGAFSVLSYINSKPVGLVNCFQGFSTFKSTPLINIHDVIVIDEFRGQGITQLMFDKVEFIAKQRHCCKITLEVLEGNMPAQRAYEKSGFTGYELDPRMGKAMFWQKEID